MLFTQLIQLVRTSAATTTTPFSVRTFATSSNRALAGSIPAHLRNAIATNNATLAIRALAQLNPTEITALAGSDASKLVALVSKTNGTRFGSRNRKAALLKDIVEKLKAADGFDGSAAVAAEVDALFDAGRVSEGVLKAQELKEKDALVMGLARVNLADRALPLVGSVGDRAKVAIVQGLANLGLLEEAQKVVDSASAPSDALYGALAAGYAQRGMLTMARKAVNDYEIKSGQKPGYICYNALIKAHSALGQPGDADQVVHGAAGNLTAASHYLHKRNETVNSNTPVDARPVKVFKPSKFMHAALIEPTLLMEKFWVHGDLLLMPGASLELHSEKPAQAMQLRSLDAASILKEVNDTLTRTASIPTNNAIAFREFCGLLIAEGLLPQQTALDLVTAIISKNSPLTTPVAPNSTESYKSTTVKLQRVIDTRARVVASSVYSLQGNVAAASENLNAAIKTQTASRGLIDSYLNIVANAVEAGSLSKEDALPLCRKGLDTLQLIKAETGASIMESVVRIAGGEKTGVTALMDLTVEEAVKTWVSVGGVPSRTAQPVLTKIVEELGVPLLI
ncbi:hypothetical protein BCR33DRAFT_788437 [Rhizoclosmatium globosum]|uniref:Uncharacterized protein n=1 Tax=Rhizoclosmatium globosum TaxID=329046 RepID=A0A1Y2BXF2_9FUNG|nr:hypothetical protein BCR33DRAFT_788437 [Rhizoclosmatium globosum]|eukprot:ORY39433.1 hypothetical protein BCR33DRAFT_788437 [Rhizoclosmatium globosum]